MIKLNFKKLNDDILMPFQKHTTDAGFDIYSAEDKMLQPERTTTISTGIALQMEFDFLPFEIKDRIPGLIHQEQEEFISNFSYYMQEYIKQMYKPFFQIESRSSLASFGVHAVGGIVDFEYTGEISIILANTSRASYTVQEGDRIAQGIVKLIPNITSANWVESFNETERGEKGFGSSGK